MGAIGERTAAAELAFVPAQAIFLPGGTSGTTSRSRRMKFTDNTLPASAAAQGAHYIIQGFRGTRAGEPSTPVMVQFGARGASNMQKQAA